MATQPPYGPQQFGPYSPQQLQPKRGHGLRNGCLITAGVLAGLLGIVIIIGAVVSATSKTPHAASNPVAPATSNSRSTSAAGAALPGIGQIVHDGDFAFTVERVSCGAAAASAVSAGGIGEKVPAGAKECIVTIKVTDDKGRAQTFFDSNQYAYDARGRQLSADTTGSIYLNGSQDATQVNPGITITARVPFQIPASDRMVRLVLHDSAFSGGVSVKV